jgi:LmbE family N-acetylglucosaminyl deacetylase
VWESRCGQTGAARGNRAPIARPPEDHLRVVAVVAHPHEAELYCGGTLARYLTAGDSIAIACVTAGNLSDPQADLETLEETRRTEAEKAAALLSARFHWLGQSDHFATADAVTAMQLVAVFREFQPDVVLTHAPGALTPDHDAVARVAVRAGQDAAQPGIEPDMPALGQAPIFFAMDGPPGTVPEPTAFVDITAQGDMKRRALECYATLPAMRATGAANLVETMRVMARYRGMQAGVEFAEGFRPIAAGRPPGARRWLP